MAIQAALSRRTRSGGASSSSAAASRRTAPATPPSSPRRPAAARDRELPDSGGSARSRSAKGSPEQPLDGLRRSPRIAESPIGAIMRGARRTAGVARGAAVLQPDPSTPLPQCIWCWMEQPDHQLKSCPEKRTPNMSDFKQARAVRTRSLGLQRSRGLPSGRTKEEQQAHEATYNTAHKQRTRALVAGAKAALAAHLEAAAQPLTPNGPCAQFTIYQRTWTCCSRWRHRCSRRWTAATRASALGASSAARLPPRGARARASRPPAQRATRAASRTTTTTIDRRRWGWAVNESTVLWRRAGCGVRR